MEDTTLSTAHYLLTNHCHPVLVRTELLPAMNIPITIQLLGLKSLARFKE